ncbi:MAG: InlB B-repeat-containing protein [Clostridia bacterium]|nr:InlB B-repeat-containing protein [Clostridia bacterium]
MKKQKILAMLVVIAMVFNICVPSFVHATDYATLDVSQFDESGLGEYGPNMSISVNSGTPEVTGFIWEDYEVGSQITLSYSIPNGYRFVGWKNDFDEIVSTDNPYTFTLNEYTSLRGSIERIDGKTAILDLRPYPVDFGWNMPNYDLDYQTVTVTNQGNVTIKDITASYPEELDVICPKTTLAPGESFNIQVKPVPEMYRIEDYKQSDWLDVSGEVEIDGGTRWAVGSDRVEIGVSASGESPYGPEIPQLEVYIEGFDQKPNQGDYLPQWTTTGNNGQTRVVPEGTHWIMYNTHNGEWEMAPGERIADGHYRYQVEVVVSGEFQASDLEILFRGPGIEDNVYYCMTTDRVEYDAQSAQTYVYAYTNDVDFGAMSSDYVTITYDPNGGTPGIYFNGTVQVQKGSSMFVTVPSAEFIAAPQGKTFDGVLVNSVFYDEGQSYLADTNLYVMYVWKDDPNINKTPIHNINLTLEKPEVGATNQAIEVDHGGYGGIEGTNKPIVTTQPDEQILVTYTDWVKGTYGTAGEEFDQIFEGTFVNAHEYYAWIEIEAKDGYYLANDCEIRINGRYPAEMFPFFDGTNTHVIAMVYAGQDRYGDQIQIWKNDGGQISVNYTPSEPNVYNLEGNDPSNWSDGGEVVQYYQGDSITVSARPNPGYEFVGWYHVDIQWAPHSSPDDPHYLPYQGEAISTDTSYTYQPSVTVVPGDSEPLRYVCARFEPTEPLDPTVVVHTEFMNGGGSYQVQYNTEDQEELGKQNKDLTSSGFFAVPEGNTMKLTAKPAAGYVFKGWYKTHEENGNTWVLDEIVSNKATYTFTPSGYPYLTPVFEQESSSQYKKGDLDRNGVVDANDASVALELYKAQNATAEDVTIGDMDENDLIDANDASLILEYYKTHQ